MLQGAVCRSTVLLSLGYVRTADDDLIKQERSLEDKVGQGLIAKNFKCSM